MLRAKVKTYHKGILYKNGRYVKMLDEGSYWKLKGDNIAEYNQTVIYEAPVQSISDLMKDTSFTNTADVIDIADNERGVVIADSLYKQVLQPGKYILWKELVKYKVIKIDLNKVELPEGLNRSILSKQELAYHLRVYKVEAYEKGVLFIDGTFTKVLNAGIYYYVKNDTPITVEKVDIRQQQLDINGQEILTKDKASLRINMYAQYKVVDVKTVLVDNKDAINQFYTIMQLSVREYVGGYTLDELLEKKNDIAPLILTKVKSKVAEIGINIADCGIKDIILPGDVKDIMNKVLIAQKQAQANTITRREETASTRSLLNTAKLMEENEMLFRLKELEYVEKIADKISNISVSGNGDLIGQLSKIFVPEKATDAR